MAEKKQIKHSKIEREAKALAAELIELLGAEAETQVKISEDLIEVNIDGQDLGLLIGYRGENIESLQLLLGLILNKKLDLAEWRPVLVDIGGWRKQREDSLKALLEKEIEKINSSQESVSLPPMPPAQRRSIHILVSEMEGLTSESSGEGSERHVVVKKVG